MGAGPARPGWQLAWSDEFEGPAGAEPDPQKWVYDVGGNGWGNKELQYYTSRRENSFLDGNGALVIRAIAEPYMGRSYTSARLKTAGKFTTTYGRIEVKAKVATGQGLWPAFWMLGANIETVSWPGCGEIDIMEHAGRAPRENTGSLHGPGYSGGRPLTATYRLQGGTTFPAGFHTFAVEWEPNVVRFYVDEDLYATQTPEKVPAGGRWVFDQPMFLLLNLAVGGTFGGDPNASTVFPQDLVVEHVRVYRRP
jgi:beta-glucanase (GH16 family)